MRNALHESLYMNPPQAARKQREAAASEEFIGSNRG